MRSRLAALVCGLFWTLLGLLLGAAFRHAWLGLSAGLFFGLSYTVFGAWAAEKYPLEVWDARLLSQDAAPNLYEMLHALSEKTDLPLPTLYACPGPGANAFAVAGRDGGTAIVVTHGLTRQLDKTEVQAAMALMTARLATGVMPGWTVTATLAGLPLYVGERLAARPGLAWLGRAVTAAFTPAASALLRLGCDPRVVTASDVHAAHLADRPDALPSALGRMESAWGLDAARPLGLGTVPLFAAPPPTAGRDAAARLARIQTASASLGTDLGTDPLETESL